MENLSGAVFIDKDGTLLEDVPFNADPAKMRLMPGAGPALSALSAAGWRIFVISNQPGVALGYFPEKALALIEHGLRDLFILTGAELSGFYYCPHHPEGIVAPYAGDCRCRKPEPGLIHRACAENRIEPRRSWMIGDILDDVEAGARAGCRTMLVHNGHETQWRHGPDRIPDYSVPDLVVGARLILGAAEL